MTTKTALTELRKLVPPRFKLGASVYQADWPGDGLIPAHCEIAISNPITGREKVFTGNCLEPCLQAASEWAMKEFGKK